MSTTASFVSPEQALRDGGRDAVLAAAREVAAEIAPRAERHDRDASFPSENFEAIWRAGLGNLTIPVERGGVGANLETTAAVVRLIAAADASTALILVMHFVSMRFLAARPGGTSALVDDVIASSLAGPALASALRVEPDLGTPARGGVPATRAEAIVDENGDPAWRISGHKIFSTGSQGLQWLMIYGATDGDGGVDQIGFFAVPRNRNGIETPGIEIVETWDHLGMRASSSHDVILRDVVIPREYAYGLAPAGQMDISANPETAALAGWLTALILEVYSGSAAAARDWLVEYLHERVPSNLGAPLASLPRFQAAVGEIEVLLTTSDRLLAGLVQDIDAGGSPGLLAAQGAVKVAITRDLIAAVGLAVELIGNPGLTYNNPLQRHYRDVLCSRIHTPQNDMVFGGSGKASLERARQRREAAA